MVVLTETQRKEEDLTLNLKQRKKLYRKLFQKQRKDKKGKCLTLSLSKKFVSQSLSGTPKQSFLKIKSCIQLNN